MEALSEAFEAEVRVSDQGDSLMTALEEDINKQLAGEVEAQHDENWTNNEDELQDNGYEVDGIDNDHEPCTVCCDTFPPNEIVKLSCSHNYCNLCLDALFESTVPSLRAPSCCDRPILNPEAIELLSKPVQATFFSKIEEIFSENLVYCANLSCSAVISKINKGRGRGRCAYCDLFTCLECCNEAHDGECKPDEDDKEMEDMTLREGWMRCTACARVIERTDGCPHMICACGAEFCYLCGQDWAAHDEDQCMTESRLIADARCTHEVTWREVTWRRAGLRICWICREGTNFDQSTAVCSGCGLVACLECKDTVAPKAIVEAPAVEQEDGGGW